MDGKGQFHSQKVLPYERRKRNKISEQVWHRLLMLVLDSFPQLCLKKDQVRCKPKTTDTSSRLDCLCFADKISQYRACCIQLFVSLYRNPNLEITVQNQKEKDFFKNIELYVNIY